MHPQGYGTRGGGYGGTYTAQEVVAMPPKEEADNAKMPFFH